MAKTTEQVGVKAAASDGPGTLAVSCAAAGASQVLGSDVYSEWTKESHQRSKAGP
jgi:hypothetical protein